MAPTTDQIATMSKQWEATDQTLFIQALYHKMFETHPEWQQLFKKIAFPLSDSDAAFQKQISATRGMLDKAVKMARDSDNDNMIKTLHAMAQRHVKYNVHQKEFQALKPILAKTVEERVPGADRAAWSETVGYVLDNIVVD